MSITHTYVRTYTEKVCRVWLQSNMPKHTVCAIKVTSFRWYTIPKISSAKWKVELNSEFPIYLVDFIENRAYLQCLTILEFSMTNYANWRWTPVPMCIQSVTLKQCWTPCDTCRRMNYNRFARIWCEACQTLLDRLRNSIWRPGKCSCWTHSLLLFSYFSVSYGWECPLCKFYAQNLLLRLANVRTQMLIPHCYFIRFFVDFLRCILRNWARQCILNSYLLRAGWTNFPCIHCLCEPLI